MLSVLTRNIITYEHAKEYIDAGYYAIDPHCHSSFSYDVPDVPETSPENVIKEQLMRGLKPVITDHDTLNAHQYLKRLPKYKKIPKDIISAVELTVQPEKADFATIKGRMHSIHINIFGINQKQFEVASEIARYKDMDILVEFLREKNLEYMYNHPFWHEPHERLNWRAIPGLAKNYFDVIELNSNRPKAFNDLAIRLAERFDKGIVASTDSHIGEPGRAMVLAEGRKFKEFWNNIKERNMLIVRKDMTTLEVVNETSAMIKHIFEANVNASRERHYTPVTGIRPLDAMARSVTSGSLKNMYFTKKFLRLFFATFNYTAGPALAWKLYMDKQNTLANSITDKVERMAKKIEDNHKRKLAYKA